MYFYKYFDKDMFIKDVEEILYIFKFVVFNLVKWMEKNGFIVIVLFKIDKCVKYFYLIYLGK